ncbi:MAG: hypothetical protein OXQ28_00280 [Acidobacteriota bacterium]|nr:hypothetical protein [Acidobacteriota bacterium]
MARFIKFDEGREQGGYWGPVYLNVYEIDGIRQVSPRRAKDGNGNFIPAQPGQLKDSDGWLLTPQVELAMHATHRGYGQSAAVLHATYLVDGELDDIAQKIEAVIECDRQLPDEGEDDPLKLNDRDVWRPGESYAALDVVKHPDDVSKTLLALKPSQSTSKLVLVNRTVWCEIVLPTANEA